jgi:hypothetical protein
VPGDLTAKSRILNLDRRSKSLAMALFIFHSYTSLPSFPQKKRKAIKQMALRPADPGADSSLAVHSSGSGLSSPSAGKDKICCQQPKSVDRREGRGEREADLLGVGTVFGEAGLVRNGV